MAYTEDQRYRLQIVTADTLKIRTILAPAADGAPLGEINPAHLLNFAQCIDDQCPRLPSPIRKGGIDPRAETAALVAELRAMNLGLAGARAAYVNDSFEKLAAGDDSPAPYDASHR